MHLLATENPVRDCTGNIIMVLHIVNEPREEDETFCRPTPRIVFFFRF